MYRVLTGIGFILCLLGGLLVMAGLLTDIKTSIPPGVSFFSIGLVLLALCEQNNRIRALQDKLVLLQANNVELKILAQSQAASTEEIKRTLQSRLPEPAPSHLNGQAPAPVVEELQPASAEPTHSPTHEFTN